MKKITTNIQRLASKAFVLLQYALPQHLLSRLMALFSHSSCGWWKNFMIRRFIKLYGVNMEESQRTAADFLNFNDFFTRELKDGCRPISAAANSVACPADGVISQIGRIQHNQLLQAKNINFTTAALLSRDDTDTSFVGGSFVTIYLSPKDYHRLHIPLAGTLQEMVHIPGKLFSVNEATSNGVADLFAANERVVAFFDTQVGEMALVLVGAMLVSSIQTVWSGVVTPPSGKSVRRFRYPDQAITLEKGQEMGRFNMGSTIIVLFGKDAITWDKHLAKGDAVTVGCPIATCR